MQAQMETITPAAAFAAWAMTPSLLLLLQDLSIIVKSYANVIVKNDFEHHVIHKRAFVDAQEYHIYKYVESYLDGDVPPSHLKAPHRPYDRNQDARDAHDDMEFDEGERRRGLVVSCKIARKFGFYVYTGYVILVSKHGKLFEYQPAACLLDLRQKDWDERTDEETVRSRNYKG
jgi:hypothetical protein